MHHQSFMVYESKTENHRLIFTVASTAVLTFDLCMHQRTHSAETVQTRVYHATSSVNNAEISPSFVNSLYGDPSHPYMAAPLWEQKKIMIFMIQQIVWRKEPKSFDVVMNHELYSTANCTTRCHTMSAVMLIMWDTHCRCQLSVQGLIWCCRSFTNKPISRSPVANLPAVTPLWCNPQYNICLRMSDSHRQSLKWSMCLTSGGAVRHRSARCSSATFWLTSEEQSAWAHNASVRMLERPGSP